MKSVTEDSTLFQDGQEMNSEPWADQMDEPEPSLDVNEDLHVEDSAEEFEIPETLKQLISFSGLCFVAVPEGTWNVDGYSANVRRGFSVIFSFDNELSSSDIVQAFMKASVDVECIYSIQFHNFNCSWCVTFTDHMSKKQILEKGIVKFRGVPVFIGDADFKTVIVKIYEAAP